MHGPRNEGLQDDETRPVARCAKARRALRNVFARLVSHAPLFYAFNEAFAKAAGTRRVRGARSSSAPSTLTRQHANREVEIDGATT